MRNLILLLITLCSSSFAHAGKMDPEGHITCKTNYRLHSKMKFEEEKKECEKVFAKCGASDEIYVYGEEFSPEYKSITTDGKFEVYQTAAPISVPGSQKAEPDMYIDVTYWAPKESDQDVRGLSIRVGYPNRDNAYSVTNVYSNDIRGEHILQRGATVERGVYNIQGLEYTHEQYPDAKLSRVLISCHRAE